MLTVIKAPQRYAEAAAIRSLPGNVPSYDNIDSMLRQVNEVRTMVGGPSRALPDGEKNCARHVWCRNPSTVYSRGPLRFEPSDSDQHPVLPAISSLDHWISTRSIESGEVKIVNKFAHCMGFLILASYSAVSIAPAYSAQAPMRQVVQTAAAAPANSRPVGPLPDSKQLRLALALPLRNQQRLQVLLGQLNNPSSPNYHKFLTVQQFTDQFGPTAVDYAKVVSFANSHGLTVTRTFSNRLLVDVAGPAATVNQAFHVTMQTYKHPTENRNFYAPDVEPTIDPGVPLLGIEGLTDFTQPRPMLQQASSATGVHSDQTGSGQNGQFLGSDMRAAYAPGVTLDGSGQVVGLIELGPYNLQDVQSYFSTIGQPLQVPIYNVLLDVDGVCSGTPGSGGCDDGEEVIDIEQAISMAPHLSGLVVYEAYGSNSDALTAFTQAANDNIAKQMSLSFGWGGTPGTEPGYEQVFMELQAQGQNLFIASGDSGANVGGVGYPGNSPNVTDAGGTDLTTAGAGGPWQAETGWIGSGGGWNTASAIPAYQTSAVNANNQGSTSFRNIPDVAMEANTDNFYCANGSCQGGIGGTSLAAPRWAGFLALANQQANGNPIGFLNPTLYAIGQQANYGLLFHDITSGNDFNSGSPDLFSAVAGYDLVTGWGTPQGQALINALAPINASGPNFALTSSVATIPLTPGSGGSSTITISPSNGFLGTISLTALAVGSPAGVTAGLSQSSITGAGSVILTVATTSATPGGTLVVAVTGASGSLVHTIYVQLTLPDFGLSVSPASLYLNQGTTTSSAISIAPLNGFDGNVTLTSSGGLPEGVMVRLGPRETTSASTLKLSADRTATTGVGAPVTVTGTAGNLQQVSYAQLSVSAAIGDRGAGVPVDLSSVYNVAAIYTDGSTFSTTGGLGGYAYSENLLTGSRVLSDILFRFGASNQLDAVATAGQTIALPAGEFSALQLLATGVNGEQSDQTITVTYTDGTQSNFTQSFSDWFSPSGNPNEAEAVAMPYRNVATGVADNRRFNLYDYTFVLDRGKTVQSVLLPNNQSVIVFAATLTRQDLGAQVDLATAFNVTGIYTDGTMFSADGGLDGGGAAYSANLLGDQAGSSSAIVNGQKFNIGPANASDAVYGSGQEIPLLEGHYRQLHLLGTGVQGAQTSQPVVVTYTDGTTCHFTQSFSDWFSPGYYPGETRAVQTAYRDYSDGTNGSGPFNLYEYTFSLDPRKTVMEVELPQNRFVLVLAITLTQ